MNVKHSNEQHLEKLPVNEMDLRAVEDWLGQMAGKGYFLDETAWSWWYFNIGEPANVRYRIEPIDEKNGKLDPQIKEDYETMGWKYVTSHKGMYHIFLAESEETEEFHTDPLVRNLALKGYEKKLRSLGISSIVAFSVFFVSCYIRYPGKQGESDFSLQIRFFYAMYSASYCFLLWGIRIYRRSEG